MRLTDIENFADLAGADADYAAAVLELADALDERFTRSQIKPSRLPSTEGGPDVDSTLPNGKAVVFDLAEIRTLTDALRSASTRINALLV